ncbi:hypothetical protein BLX24_08000 [Arsenicibacter rosenii]|uniref:Uncharacterized protein n=2 Tax=Arsenicibacter rosenii TaxID=1750698 RepID=A0A1S2VN14_9BACT|nr:hypothetical protein BLX24_08000 [Arsenicibacter rosenii]
MIGKTFMVNAFAHKIVNYQIQDGRLTLVSDRKFFPAVELVNADRFLEQFLETDEEALPAVVAENRRRFR